MKVKIVSKSGRIPKYGTEQSAGFDLELQAKILTALWEKLKPNGVLLYATCSLLPYENSLQIQRFLQQTPNAELMLLPFQTDKSAVGFQFVPSPLGGDGFYYAKLRKTEILK